MSSFQVLRCQGGKRCFACSCPVNITNARIFLSRPSSGDDLDANKNTTRDGAEGGRGRREGGEATRTGFFVLFCFLSATLKQWQETSLATIVSSLYQGFTVSITVSRIYGVHHCIKDLPCIVSRIYYVHHCIKDLPCTVSRIYRVHHCIKDLPCPSSYQGFTVYCIKDLPCPSLYQGFTV